MKSKHIAFIVESAHGHINPTLGTASELVRRGYQVSHAVKDYFAPRVEACGSKAVVYKPLEKKLSVFRQMYEGGGGDKFDFDFSDELLKHAKNIVRQESDDTLNQLENLYRDHKPDLIIFDSMNVAGKRLAAKWNVSTIEHCPVKISDRLSDYDPNLVIVSLPRFFQENVDKLGNRFQFVGPVFNDGKFFKPWPNDSGAKDVILVAATTGLLPQVDYFVRAVHALRGLPGRVVLSIGEDIDPKELGSLPGNFSINQFSSQSEILANARLLICHGGPSSCFEALRHGVPLLLLPPSQVHDSFARRFAELGLGIRLLKPEVSVDSLRESAISLLNDAETLARVKQAQLELNECNGALRAADLIEQFINTRFCSSA